MDSLIPIAERIAETLKARRQTVAVARQMPRVEPVTSASFPVRSMFIRSQALWGR